jgi:hypothetical protein
VGRHDLTAEEVVEEKYGNQRRGLFRMSSKYPRAKSLAKKESDNLRSALTSPKVRVSRRPIVEICKVANIPSSSGPV